MELALITMEKIIEMFLIMIIGAAAFKTGIIDAPANKRLSGLLLKVISPAMLFMAYQIDFEPERLRGLGITLGLSALSFVWTILLVNMLIRPGKSRNVEIERMASIYSNCGFIGIPLINGIMGREGVFYLTAYITAFNIAVWSHGLALMCGTSSLKTTLKNFIQPATIAIGLGVLCFLLQIRLPSVAANPLNMVGDMNTPVAMLVAGCNLAESNLPEAVKRSRSYWISFIKLLLIPFVSILLLKLIPAEQIYTMTVLIAIACPTGAMGTMFALQYNKDSNYASELFTISTVLSLVTIPFVILLAGLIL